MKGKQSRHSVVHGAIIGRTQFIELLLVALLLALGVNFVSDGVREVFSVGGCTTLVTGVSLCLVSIGYLGYRYLGFRVFTGYTEARTYEGFLIYDAALNEMLSVPRYPLGEAIARYLKGAFLENEALRVLWDKEPLSAFGSGEFVQLVGEDEGGCAYLVKDLRSLDLVCEAVEYFLLSELSAHLMDYFQSGQFRKKRLRQYGREDLADILFTNRFLELFSRPMDQRPEFVRDALQSSWLGEVYAAQSPNGVIYERFDLVLPKGSTVRRGHTSCDVGQSRIEIDTGRMSISFEVCFIGFSSWVPRGFVKYYLGVDERRTEDTLQVWAVDVVATISLKAGALLFPAGWDYYRWIDSFLERLEECLSKEAFFQQINWDSALTVLDCLSRCR